MIYMYINYKYKLSIFQKYVTKLVDNIFGIIECFWYDNAIYYKVLDAKLVSKIAVVLEELENSI